MENNNTNLYTPTEMPKEPSSLKIFWQNLSSKQRYMLIIGGVVIMVLLVVVVVMIVNQENSGQSTDEKNGVGGTEVSSEEDDSTTMSGETAEDYVDATATPIEGGDPNDINTYLPHTLMSETVYDEGTQEEIKGAIWSIEVDKEKKEIWLFMHNLDDQETKDVMRTYLDSIPQELLKEYSIKEAEF